jgi:hypothetical protein
MLLWQRYGSMGLVDARLVYAAYMKHDLFCTCFCTKFIVCILYVLFSCFSEGCVRVHMRICCVCDLCVESKYITIDAWVHACFLFHSWNHAVYSWYIVCEYLCIKVFVRKETPSEVACTRHVHAYARACVGYAGVCISMRDPTYPRITCTGSNEYLIQTSIPVVCYAWIHWWFFYNI